MPGADPIMRATSKKRLDRELAASLPIILSRPRMQNPAFCRLDALPIFHHLRLHLQAQPKDALARNAKQVDADLACTLPFQTRRRLRGPCASPGGPAQAPCDNRPFVLRE